MPDIRTLLIANRGEIALRIARTARRMGLRTVAVFSDADTQARHAREMDAAVRIGGAAPRDSYLNIEALLAAARQAGADAVHPGYGFLAESAEFAEAVLAAGLTWVGPTPAAIRTMGDKAEAKRLAHAAGVPVLAGYDGADQGDAALARAAQVIGWPVMVKAAAGGGGRGMRLVDRESELLPALAQARSEALHAFGDGRLLLERAVENARHVEVQVFADTHGSIVHLGERDCSVQRRHQKLIEESPSPAVDAALRARLGAAAVAAARAVSYVGAGTIEFLLDEAGSFAFLEANTRLQVEHPVTELVTGLDLVEWQLRVAAGEPLPWAQDQIRFVGHAIEARLCAEDAAFLPQAGRLSLWAPVAGVRIDHALETGAEIAPYYDSLIAKVIAHGPTREAARLRLAQALDDTVALGVPTNKAFLAALLREETFADGRATTDFVARRFAASAPATPAATTLAIAAVLIAEGTGFGEWTSWSSNPARSMRFRIADREIALRFADGAYEAEIDGARIALRILWLAPPRARIACGDTVETVVFVRDRDALDLARGGESWRLTDTLHAPPAHRGAAASDGRVVAPMNGRVVAVHAKAGDPIAAGGPLVVLEAMKMEHGLTAPLSGRVAAVHVVAGAQVAPGQLLVELEPA
ncbi:MAG: biotin/lipoyl-binding protein [Xanthobacteraceae bacterium]|nr:biotin/lipoyl-binding protein [Xanthobacteraceae bacterium]